MTKYFIILVFSLLTTPLFCQKPKIEFRDYNQILKDLKVKGQNSEFYNGIVIESILYLDKRCLKELLKLDQKFLIKFNLDTMEYSTPGINRYTKYFKTEFTDVRDYFIDQKGFQLLRKYLIDQDYDNFKPDSPIYTKDSTKAVFSNGYKTYRISIENGLLRTELLYQVIE